MPLWIGLIFASFSKFEVNSQELFVVSFNYIKHSQNTQTKGARKQIVVVYLNVSHLLPKLTLSEKRGHEGC